MPLYFRKSVKAGPFRFNFSKSGVGVSVGVKGLRFGTGPRGHYVHAGIGGIYYRESIGRAGQRKSDTKSTADRLRPLPQERTASGVDMIEIDSGDVLQMRDEKFSNLLDELNAKHMRPRLSYIFLWSWLAFAALIILLVDASGAILFPLALPFWGLGKWIDAYKRVSVVFYELAPEVERSFRQVTIGFDGIMTCSAKWHIEAGGAVRDLTTWKQNAGASHLVSRTITTLEYRLPEFLKSNITPPSIKVGKQILYFFPDVCLVQDGQSVGAVGYADLELQWQPSRFIEEGPVPSDAMIVDYTWQYPNKKGGPDRRFKNNRQIPVCLYEALHFGSATGLNELVEFSRANVVTPFASAMKALPKQSVPLLAR